MSTYGGSNSAWYYELAANGSGGYIEPYSGRYTPGDAAGTEDVVRVHDGLGNSVDVTLEVTGSGPCH